MKHRLFGIYGKVFFYTLLILVVVLITLFLFFSNQIKVVELSARQQQITEIFQPFYMNLNGKPEDEIIATAKAFHEKNAAFEFCIENPEGKVLFQTDHFEPPEKGFFDNHFNSDADVLIPALNGHFRVFNALETNRAQFISLISNGYKLYVSNLFSDNRISKLFIDRLLLAFMLILLASVAAAALFARRIAKPIKSIAADTRKMSELEDVSEPVGRKDEIGQLAGDVYKMYTNLKCSIQRLEAEIEKEREMEENQRYFFAAASHELKTPIAAVSALLEGVLEEVVEPSEYPLCIRECLKIMNEQNKLVSEILELVTLNSHTVSDKRESVGLREWVSEVYASCKAIADSKSLKVTINVSDNLDCRMNRKLLARAFSNVMVNAIQNTAEGGEISIAAKDKNQAICLSVLNKGAEIPDDILPKLFAPFYREDKARTRKSGRSGLGLTIVKKTMDLLNIPFSLSNTREGVLFEMELPRSQ